MIRYIKLLLALLGIIDEVTSEVEMAVENDKIRGAEKRAEETHDTSELEELAQG